MTQLASPPLPQRLEELLIERARVCERFFATEAQRIATLCHRCAERFARGGRMLALGASPAARSDARHVAVEFVHPVIVGKRALPALALTAETGPVADALALMVEPDDIVIAFDSEDALEIAVAKGALTIAFSGPAERSFEVPSGDPHVSQEIVETLYHVLWELVHVFFEHRGLLAGRSEQRVHDVGASSFLYPFLGEHESDLESVLGDVERSIRLKAREVTELREQTLGEGAPTLCEAAAQLRARFDTGGRLLIAGNGGSATDAIDLAADLRFPLGAWPARPAVDLTEDTSILTALANDIGVEALFSRQVIAHGRTGDAFLAISTSGNSDNVIAALAEARSRGLLTVAMVGYDGGRVASEALADHVVVTRSQHIPRIQEAQASAYHALRELIELAEAPK